MSNMTSTNSTLVMKKSQDEICPNNLNLKCHTSYIDDDNSCPAVLSGEGDLPIVDSGGVDGKEDAPGTNDLIPLALSNNMSPHIMAEKDSNGDSIKPSEEPKDDKSNAHWIDVDESVPRLTSSTSDESTFDTQCRNSSASLDGDDEYDEVLHDPIAVTSKFKEMEEEQEHLNNSLIALTSHFAQVQLRLKQIVGASSDEKERLLKDLEEFAFSGIPDLASVHHMVNQTEEEMNEDQDERSEDSKCPSPSSQGSPRKSERGIKTSSESDLSSKLQSQREKQQKLMGKLKDQLEELEKYAYQTGDSKCIPSSMLIERQNVIIEQLKGTLALNLDQMDKLSPDQLRQQVDQALKNLIDPVIMKEQLVEQLKTQVTDLERFIEYLQAGQMSIKCKNGKHFKLTCDGACTCACPLHGNSVTSVQKYNPLIANHRKKQQCKHGSGKGGNCCGDDEDCGERSSSAEAIKMIKRVMTLLQMVTVTQFGCNKTVKKYERNIFNRKFSHATGDKNCYEDYDLWNNMKSKLDTAIDHLIEITQEKFANDSDYTSDSDDNVFTSTNDDSANDTTMDEEKSNQGETCKHETSTNEISSQGLRSQKLTHAVRKELCSALTDLLEHGLREDVSVSNSLIDTHASNQSSALVSSFLIWGCFSDRSSNMERNSSTSSRDGKWQRPSVWNVFMKFYQLKDGTCYTSAPARRLSQSFNLPIVGSTVVTPKQSLLMAIFDICQSHTPLKRSPESHFKALVSRALNEGKLTSWLRQIVKSRSITQSMYEPWSYVVSTGFDDALESLDKLNSIRFNLPTDLAIRQLKSISDAF